MSNTTENDPSQGSDATDRSLLGVFEAATARTLGTVAGATGAAVAALTTAVGAGSSEPPASEPRAEPDETRPDWDVDVATEDVDSLGVGDTATFTRTVHEDDVHRFALASGDTNPLHLDAGYAGETRFDDRIVHGTLVSGLVSAAMARLPGVVVVLSQNQEFRAPVRVGDRATAEVELVEALGDDRYRLRTTVRAADGTVCLDGEVCVLVEPAPGE